MTINDCSSQCNHRIPIWQPLAQTMSLRLSGEAQHADWMWSARQCWVPLKFSTSAVALITCTRLQHTFQDTFTIKNCIQFSANGQKYSEKRPLAHHCGSNRNFRWCLFFDGHKMVWILVRRLQVGLIICFIVKLIIWIWGPLTALDVRKLAIFGQAKKLSAFFTLTFFYWDAKGVSLGALRFSIGISDRWVTAGPPSWIFIFI